MVAGGRLVVAFVLALAVLGGCTGVAVAQSSAITTCAGQSDCIGCVARSDCVFCTATARCVVVASPEADVCVDLYNRSADGVGSGQRPVYSEALLSEDGTCEDQQCAWFSLSLNARVCDELHLYTLASGVVTAVAALCFLPCVYKLGRAPWTDSVTDDSEFCVFSDKAVDGSKVCDRCGVVVAALHTNGENHRVCVGCATTYKARGVLALAVVFAAMALSIFFIEWSVPSVGLVICGLVWLLVYPYTGYLLGRPSIRRYLFSNRGQYALIGAGLNDGDLSPESEAVIAGLPQPFRSALVKNLQMDEEVLWAEKPSCCAVFRRHTELHRELLLGSATMLPCLLAGLYIHSVSTSSSSTPEVWLFLFVGLFAFFAYVPSVVPMILNEFVAYALTTRRAIKIRRGALCGTSVASTDFRVMREVVATLDGNAQGDLGWRNRNFAGFVHVTSADRVTDLLLETAAQRRADLRRRRAARVEGGRRESPSASSSSSMEEVRRLDDVELEEADGSEAGSDIVSRVMRDDAGDRDVGGGVAGGSDRDADDANNDPAPTAAEIEAARQRRLAREGANVDGGGAGGGGGAPAPAAGNDDQVTDAEFFAARRRAIKSRLQSGIVWMVCIVLVMALLVGGVLVMGPSSLPFVLVVGAAPVINALVGGTLHLRAVRRSLHALDAGRLRVLDMAAPRQRIPIPAA